MHDTCEVYDENLSQRGSRLLSYKRVWQICFKSSPIYMENGLLKFIEKLDILLRLLQASVSCILLKPLVSSI